MQTKSSKDLRRTDGLSSENPHNRFEKIMVQKLAYDWKNIYRMLQSLDVENTGQISVFDFEKSCIKAGITLGQADIQRLVKNYGGQDETNF